MTRFFRRHSFLLLVAALLGSVVAPVLLQGSASQRLEKAVRFNPEPLRLIRDHNPDFLFLGNSMLDSRIDQARLQSLLPGRRVMLLTGSGDSSAVWFLELKNYVAAAGVRPRKIFIFFHDDDFLRPLKNTTGIYQVKLDMVSHAREPVFERVRARNLTPGMRIEDLLAVRRGRAAADRAADRAAFAAVRAARVKSRRPPGELPDLRSNINQMFTLENARARTPNGTPADTSTLDYESWDEASAGTFLPPVAALARRHDLPLVFFRVETAPDPDGRVHQSPALRRSLRGLEAYVERNGFQYADLTGDPALSAAMYSDDVHVAPPFKIQYTDIFARRMADLLQ